MLYTIERYIDGAWQAAATVTSTGDIALGHRGAVRLEYLHEYALEYLGRPEAAIACGYEVGFEIHNEPAWPAFALDILPQGAGRRWVLGEMNIPRAQDGNHLDWEIILRGGGNPVGDLRIQEAVPPAEAYDHPGFPREDVLQRQEEFIEYARAHGAPVAGSAGAQGEAPKFLLTTDMQGRWHADGALPDAMAAAHYLVKFPRGSSASDRQILRNEAGYYETARAFGLRVGPPLVWEDDTLFVGRFDRQTRDGWVERYGVHSLYALAGVREFGVPVRHDVLATALARFSTTPREDVVEYVLRDVLNVALRNTDNHGRNQAVLRRAGQVALSPLYDFPPMFLDDAGIPRTCRWPEGAETAGMPDWGKVAEVLAAQGAIEAEDLRTVLAGKAEDVRRLAQTMRECNVEQAIIERLVLRIDDVARALDDAAPRAQMLLNDETEGLEP